jgi:hypothetical protein
MAEQGSLKTKPMARVQKSKFLRDKSVVVDIV